MNCPNCGQPTRERARFCPNCGERLSHPATQAAPGSGADASATMPLRTADVRKYAQRAGTPDPAATMRAEDLASTMRAEDMAATMRATGMPPIPAAQPAPPPVAAVSPAAPPRTRHKWYRPGAPAFLIVGGITLIACVVAVMATDPNKANTEWYIARSTGFAAYVLLTLSVILGLILATRWRAFTGPWLVCERLHPVVLLTGFGFLILHILALILISYPVAQTLIPFISTFDPPAISLGIIAMYLMFILLVSTYLIGFIGYRTWHVIHYAGLLSWLFALGHAARIGNDSGEGWAKGIYLGGAVIVVALLLIYLAGRVVAARRRAAAH